MAVGIIPRNRSVLQPNDTLQSENSLKFGLDIIPVEIFIAVDGAEALRRGEQCALAIRVYAASLQYVRPHVHVLHIFIENIVKEDFTGYEVILVRGEFQTPAIEDEVIQILLSVVPIDGNSAVVTGPGIIDSAFAEDDPVNVNIESKPGGKFLNPSGRILRRCSYNQQVLVLQNRLRNPRIAFLNLLQFVPRSRVIRPRELDAALSFPFCWQSHIANFLFRMQI